MEKTNSRKINISDISSYINKIESNKNDLKENLKKYMKNIQDLIDKKYLEGNVKKSLEELNSVIKKFLDYDDFDLESYYLYAKEYIKNDENKDLDVRD